jgi:NAD-dependent DNA ligase
MIAEDDRREIDRLREEIRRHDYLYFIQNKPEISDEKYDRLVLKLRELEAAHPELVTPDSPTQRVGERPIEGFEHVQHSVPMLSIDNTYSPDAGSTTLLTRRSMACPPRCGMRTACSRLARRAATAKSATTSRRT